MSFARVSAKKFPERGHRKKKQKIEKRPKNSTIKPLAEGGQRKKSPKNSKKIPKNSIIKPFSTISVPSMKIQGGHGPSLPPAADAHGLLLTYFIRT